MKQVRGCLFSLLGLATAACGSVTSAGNDAGNDSDASPDGAPIDAAPDASIDSAEPCLGPGVCLTGTPDPSKVLTNDHCYLYPNNLVNSIWHSQTNLMISGHFNLNGVWAFPAETGKFATAPDVGAEDVNRLVHMPLTNTVVHSGNNQFAAAGTTHFIGTISPQTGAMSGFAPIKFSDNFSGNCNLISASPDELLCYDGAKIFHYRTTEGSATVTLTKTVSLTPAPSALCDGACFGGTFGWDGMFYYFPKVGNTSGGADYEVFDADGGLVNTFTAPGGGNVTGIYFDWSIGRYATHDGFGARTAATNYASDGGGIDDSQCYSAVSPAHSPGA